ncbi:MAG: PKD domain-containing protein [bacterium]|nr:PKD domain-containing protein [bacterium]
MKRIFMSLLCLVLLCGNAHSYIADQNLLVISGKDTRITEGDTHNRSIFYIEAPQSLSAKLYIRIFDADLAGRHDRWEEGSEQHYHLYGKGDIDWNLRTISDPVASQNTLAELRLGENRYYDDQWRTIAAPDISEGEPRNNKVYFQLIVDGARGKAINKYQVFVSALEKENKTIEGIRIFSPVVMLYLPPASEMATQIRFDIPADAEYLNIFNFDADGIEYEVSIDFETNFTKPIPIPPSKDAQVSTTQVNIGSEVRGKTGALVIRNKRGANHIQLWVFDDKGNTVPLLLPVFIGPENHLPIPEIRTIPLSECFSVMLDASVTSDPDGDELEFEWVFPDGTRAQGSRIIHDFETAGSHAVTLVVSDRSGFVANSSKLIQIIRINTPPTAAIDAPDKGVPQTPLTFDASGSWDADGTILKYLWNFGDGTRGSGKTLTHSYSRSGKYQITLIVEDDSQSLCSQARKTSWARINTPPVPHLSLKPIGAVGEAIELDASASVDSDGEMTQYRWDFGDNTTAEGEKVSHQWEKPGRYTVRLSVTDDAGLTNSSAEEEAEIVINAPPVALAMYREVIAIQEKALFDGAPSHDPDGKLRKYVWDTGDGTVKEGEKIRHAYELPGMYTVSLTVTDDTETLNNTVSTTFKVRVNDPPVPAAGEDQVVNSSEVFFDASASTDSDDDIIDYLWDFGDGTRTHGKAVSHVYALPGKYTITLTVTDGSGTSSASQPTTMNVIVNHPPIADAGGARTASMGETLTFDGRFSDDPDGELDSYQWHVAEGVILKGARVEYQYSKPGIYQVRLTVTDNVGAESTDYAVITVNAPPIADFYPLKRTEPGQTVSFDGTSSTDQDGQIRHASWDFGDDTPVLEGLSAQHSFSIPGRYAVTLTVRDNSETSDNMDSITEIIEVNYPPQADAGHDIHTCRQKIRFDGSKSTDPDGDLLRYYWDFGDGTHGQGRKIEHSYISPGIYPVLLTVDDGHGLSNSVSHTKIVAHVEAPPDAIVQMNSKTVCAGELVLFDAGQSYDPEKGLLRYVWDLGDGKSIEGINPVRSYKKGGDYTIRLGVTDDSHLSCNSAEAESILHVIDAPIAEAGDDQSVCANTLVQFDGSGSTGGGRRIKSYEWDFGDGQFGVGVKPTHLYSHAGEYTARLIITVAGESECANISEAEVSIKVIAAPIASFQAKESACAGESIPFDAGESKASDGNITEFLWDFGDENSDSGEQVSHAYTTPGTYHATLRISTDSEQSCKTGEYSQTVSINSVPRPVIQVASSDEAPFSAQVYDTDVHALLRFSGAGSEDSDGYIRSYTWDFGDGQQESGPFVSHQYEEPGEYPLILHVRDNSETACNTRAGRLLVRVREPILQSISGPDVACMGQAEEYAFVSDNPPEWVFSDGTTDTGSRVKKSFHAPGTFQIQVKVGETWTSAREVTVLALPEIGLPKTIEAYPDDTVEIQPVYKRSDDPPLLFYWDMGDGTMIETEKVDHIYKEPGEYPLKLLVTTKDAPECLRTIYHRAVSVHAPPEVEIQVGPDRIFTGGARDAVLFEAVTKSDREQWNYLWDFGDGEKAIGRRVSHAYKKSGTFQVIVTLSDPLQKTSQTYAFSKQIEVEQRK